MTTFRVLTLAAVCGAVAWGGFQLSHMRAGVITPPLADVLAAAGDESGLLASAAGPGSDRSYKISALSVFSNVALHVKDNYVEPTRINPRDMLESALNEIERQIAEVMVEDEGDGRLRIRVIDQEKTIEIDDVESLWEINLKLREVFRFFERTLPEQEDMRAIEYAAVNGALSTLDPHSILLKPEAFQEMKTSTKGEFGGLGIVISIRDAKLTVISPLDGTPASRAGLKAGDVISRIGDVSTVSMAIEEAVQMLRGPEGSKVTIWVDRKSWPDSKRFTVVRERIKIESVESELLSNNVGYIKIKNFQQNTGKDLEAQLQKIGKKAGGRLNGLVLDLRNNPGGLLEQAIRVSDKFLTSGDIVTTVGYGNKLREPKRARWSDTESDLPIAVLVNKGSASASEIVAGALKNLDRAVVIGETTFGKGSVQVLYDFADNSALKLTIAQYLTPGGLSIQNIGVEPDIELNPSWVSKDGVRLFYRPEGHREKNLDKHLDRAGKPDDKRDVPTYSMTYLLDADKEDPPEGFREDYPITLARELLSAAGANTRSKMLESGRTFMRSRKAAQDQKIASELGKLDVDWRARPQFVEGTPASKLEVSLALKDAPPPKDDKKGEKKEGKESKASAPVAAAKPRKPVVEAGEAVMVEATVRNLSDRPLYRVHGTLDSEHPAFKGRELMFGYMAPGETRTWQVKTRVAKDVASRADLLALKLEDDRGPTKVVGELQVTTRDVPHPQLAYHYVIDDSERGDGDGRLEVGEGADFVVMVTNTGRGEADEVSLRLKSAAKEDLFLERGRTVVGKIGPGETKSGRLKFRVPEAQSGRGVLPIELTIYDTGTGEWTEDRIDLKAEPNEKTKGASLKHIAKFIRSTPVRASADRNGPVIGAIDKGQRLVAVRKADGAIQVDLQNGAKGWVPRRAVRLSRRLANPQVKRSKVAAYPLQRPPTIELDEQLAGSVVTADNVLFTGTVYGRRLRDMYVLLNDEKVYFASGPKPAAAKADAKAPKAKIPDERAVKLPFEVPLKLKEGLNKVLIVARLNEQVVSYRRMFITRHSTRGSEVAKADEKTTDGQQSR
ncbi:MAG: MXAN_5808 family serine peptidase [Myxococcota bacterium]